MNTTITLILLSFVYWVVALVVLLTNESFTEPIFDNCEKVGNRFVEFFVFMFVILFFFEAVILPIYLLKKIAMGVISLKNIKSSGAYLKTLPGKIVSVLVGMMEDILK